MTETGVRTLQIAWLEKYKIPFTQGHKGGLNVLTAVVERRHGLKTEVKEEAAIDMDSFRRMHV